MASYRINWSVCRSCSIGSIVLFVVVLYGIGQAGHTANLSLSQQARPARQLKYSGATSESSAPRKEEARRGQGWSDSDVVLVNLPAFGACNGSIRRLTCLSTVVTSDLGYLTWDIWDDDMTGQLCDEVRRLGRWTGKADRRAGVPSAHVGCCVQHKGQVGVAVTLRSNVSRLPLRAQDVHSVVALLGSGSHRIVSRTRVIVPTEYHRVPVALNFSKGLAEAWKQANEVDANLGNLVWQFGVTRIMNPYTTVVVKYDERSKGDFYDAVLVAAANLFHMPEEGEHMPDTIKEFTGNLTSIVMDMNLPSVMFGVGIQAEISNHDTASTMSRLHLDKMHVDMLAAFRARTSVPSVSVSGKITSSLCEKANVSVCVPLGCPSFTINRHDNLGATLRQQWQRVAQKIGSASLKIALYLPPVRRETSTRTLFDEEAYSLIIRLYKAYDCFFILQSQYEYTELMQRAKRARATNLEHRVKFFIDMDVWMKHIQNIDFVVGCRIEGNMVAVGAGKASLLIPTDLRTAEMAEAMSLPHIPLGGLSRAAEFNLPKTVRSIASSFDFENLELTRRHAIRTYKSIMNDAGLELAPDLEEIAAITA